MHELLFSARQQMSVPCAGVLPDAVLDIVEVGGFVVLSGMIELAVMRVLAVFDSSCCRLEQLDHWRLLGLVCRILVESHCWRTFRLGLAASRKPNL